jgi:hypothetical protein
MNIGQEKLDELVGNGNLELCPPNVEGAYALIRKAETHHVTAEGLAEADPEIAMDALHAGNRKALESVLLVRGLRATKAGGHIAPLEAVRAMVGGGALRVYNVVRQLRHAGDYSNATSRVDPQDIKDNLEDSKNLVSACKKALDLLPPFVRGRR